MDSRLAADLLYESVSTLRMVDNVLDELRIADSPTHAADHRQSLAGSDGLTQNAGLEIPPDFCVRAYWQIQETLDCVQQGREALQASGPVPAGGGEATCDMSEERAAIYRTFAYLDRLEILDGSTVAERAAVHHELRQDLVLILNRAERRTERDDKLSFATSLMAEAEARLTSLSHTFETLH